MDFKITSKTRLFGVVGHPVAHSLSPVMMNAAFRSLGLDAVYLAFDVKEAGDIVGAARALGLGGLSVTIPHKEAVIPFLDGVEDDAREIGAVNTIVNDSGRLIGQNTDWLGATGAIEEAAGPVRGKLFMILGSGGAARAVAWGLVKRGAKVVVAARDQEKARRVAEPLGGLAIPLENAGEFKVHGMVNATPLGMAPDTGAIPIDPRAIKEGVVVLDTVYRPVRTLLLKEADARGALPVSGLRMLLHQAAGQVEAWTRGKAPFGAMEEALDSWVESHAD